MASVPLRAWNIAAAVLHFLLFATLLVLFLVKNRDGFSFPFLRPGVEESDTDEWSKTKHTERTTESRAWVPGFIVAFFGLTSMFHVYYATDGFGSGVYSAGIQTGRQRVRWLEYGITATLMLAAIALMSGAASYPLFLLLLVANVVVMAQGDVVEAAMASGGSTLPGTLTGWALMAAIITAVVATFVHKLEDAREHEDDIPQFVNYVLVVTFLFFTSFGVLQLVQARQGGSYITYEKLYILLSFVSKATLGIWTAVGLLSMDG